ncbi:unnamed protein product, partial [Mesorhabditis spiculigera]
MLLFTFIVLFLMPIVHSRDAYDDDGFMYSRREIDADGYKFPHRSTVFHRVVDGRIARTDQQGCIDPFRSRAMPTTFAAKSCLVKDVEYGCIECPVGFEIDQVYPVCNPWNETLAVNMELVAKDYDDATVIALPSPEDRYCEDEQICSDGYFMLQNRCWECGAMTRLCARCELNMNLWRPRVQDRTRRKRQFGDDDDDSDDDEDDVVAPPVDDKPYIEVDDREWEDVPHPHGEVNRIVNDENYFHAPGFFYSKFFRSLDEWKVYWTDKEEDGRKKTNIFGPFCVSEDCMENCEAETDFEVFLLHPCPTCKPGAYKNVNGYCVKSCPNGTYATTETKPPSCVPCLHPHLCSQCDRVFGADAAVRSTAPYTHSRADEVEDPTLKRMFCTALHTPSSHPECIEGIQYTDSGGDCRLCHPECNGCYGPSPDQCKKCRHFMDTWKRCVPRCPDGFRPVELRRNEFFCNFRPPHAHVELVKVTFNQHYSGYQKNKADILLLCHLLLYLALQFLASIAALLFSGPDNAALIPWNKEHDARARAVREAKARFRARRRSRSNDNIKNSGTASSPADSYPDEVTAGRNPIFVRRRLIIRKIRRPKAKPALPRLPRMPSLGLTSAISTTTNSATTVAVTQDEAPPGTKPRRKNKSKELTTTKGKLSKNNKKKKPRKTVSQAAISLTATSATTVIPQQKPTPPVPAATSSVPTSVSMEPSKQGSLSSVAADSVLDDTPMSSHLDVTQRPAQRSPQATQALPPQAPAPLPLQAQPSNPVQPIVRLRSATATPPTGRRRSTGRMSTEQKKQKSPLVSRAPRQHLSPKQVTQQESKYTSIHPTVSTDGKALSPAPEDPKNAVQPRRNS